jgi:selenide, water dikinase
VSEEDLLPLYDPQTSGGLLLAVPEARTSTLVRALQERGVAGALVGEVVEEAGVRVTR